MTAAVGMSAEAFAEALRGVDSDLGSGTVNDLLRAQVAGLRDACDAEQDLIVARDRAAARLRRLEQEASKALADMPFPVPPPTAQQAGSLMWHAQRDVAELAVDVRELDPALVWARLSSWPPQRLMCVLIAAAACVDPNRPLSEQAAWISDQDLDREAA